MKKLLTVIFSLSLILTGCGAQTPYDHMTNQINDILSSAALNMVVGGTIHSTDEKVNGTAYDLDYTFNNKNDLIKADVDDVQIYITNDTVYINAIGKWIKKTVSVNDNDGIQQAIAYKNLITDLPKGNKPLGSDTTGITEIDNTLSGKKLDDLVVSTDDKTYSITGLDNLTISITDSIRIDYNSDKLGKVYLTYAPSDTVKLPDEAEKALNMDNIGGA